MIYYSVIILILIIIFVILSAALVIKFSNITPSKKEVSDLIKGDGTNMLNCPYGCIRGACIKNNKSDKSDKSKCHSDKECQDCQDIVTGMFYEYTHKS